MLINLINPKYYFPIRGEYRDQVYNAIKLQAKKEYLIRIFY